MLGQLGWEIVDVWWRDLRHPERVLAELIHLVRGRTAGGVTVCLDLGGERLQADRSGWGGA